MKATAARLAAIVVMVTACDGLGADWPQIFGPRRDSTSPETGLMRSWPEDGPEVLWTADVGRGFGGPAVKNGEVYLLDRDDAVGDNLRCFDLSSGEELWNFAYDAPGSVSFPGSRSVPTVEGDHVYSCGHNGDLYLKSSSGELAKLSWPVCTGACAPRRSAVDVERGRRHAHTVEACSTQTRHEFTGCLGRTNFPDRCRREFATAVLRRCQLPRIALATRRAGRSRRTR